MFRAISATSAAFAVLCAACPASDGLVEDAGDADIDAGGIAVDAGPEDAGFNDAGPTEECPLPAAPTPSSACPPGCISEERNIETQASLLAFVAAEHSEPILTVNIFGEILDIAPLQDAEFTARTLTVNGPSSVPDLVFPGIDARAVVGFGGPGIRSIEFPRITALFSLSMNGLPPEFESLRLPNLQQAASVAVANNPNLCDIDLGATSSADICDPEERADLLRGTCVDGGLEIRSCCAEPFE